MMKKIGILILIMIITYYISNHFCQLLLINGQSMYPTYHNFQIVLILKYKRDYEINDVIAFKCDTLNSTLIKRIVGLPGDCIVIKEGILYVNNIPSTIMKNDTCIEYAGIAETPIHLAADEYFVIGDNYSYSKDSRYAEIGAVKENAILGKIYP